MELSEKLATLRKSKGLSQLELAEEINVSRQAVSRWEVGTATPSAENLKCLSGFYEISIDDLLEIERVPSVQVQLADEKTPSMGSTERLGKTLKICMAIFACMLIFAISVILADKAIGGDDSLEDTSIIQIESEVWEDSSMDSFSIGW